MAEIWLCKEADDELESLYEVDEDAAAALDLLIERLAEDSSTLEYLCKPRNHFTYEPPFEVGRVGVYHSDGKNIYKIKVRKIDGTLVDWRMLVGFHAQKDIYYVLAITDREHSYDTKHESATELYRRYEEAGIPDYR